MDTVDPIEAENRKRGRGVRRPSMSVLNEWMNEGGAEATDGCWVEPDGHCEHGKPSWLIVLGMI